MRRRFRCRLCALQILIRANDEKLTFREEATLRDKFNGEHLRIVQR